MAGKNASKSFQLTWIALPRRKHLQWPYHWHYWWWGHLPPWKQLETFKGVKERKGVKEWKEFSTSQNCTQVVCHLGGHRLSSVLSQEGQTEEVGGRTRAVDAVTRPPLPLPHPVPCCLALPPPPAPVTYRKAAMGPGGATSLTLTFTSNRVEIPASNIYTRPLLQKINANHDEEFKGAYVLCPAPLLLKG